jgi:hypothetical protein
MVVTRSPGISEPLSMGPRGEGTNTELRALAKKEARGNGGSSS